QIVQTMVRTASTSETGARKISVSESPSVEGLYDEFEWAGDRQVWPSSDYVCEGSKEEPEPSTQKSFGHPVVWQCCRGQGHTHRVLRMVGYLFADRSPDQLRRKRSRSPRHREG